MSESERVPGAPDEFDFCCGKPKRCPKIRFDGGDGGALIFATTAEIQLDEHGAGIRFTAEQLSELKNQLAKRGF